MRVDLTAPSALFDAILPGIEANESTQSSDISRVSTTFIAQKPSINKDSDVARTALTTSSGGALNG